MMIIFSDLDGTLLHPQTYSFDPAKPALGALKERGYPLIFCTSKTRWEVEYWRHRLGNEDPFIVENGGAVYVPSGYFPCAVPASRTVDGYDVIEFGSPYEDLVDTLRTAAGESGCEVLGFHDMTVAEVCLRTRLPVQDAEMAKRREYDEPFEILSPGSYRLLQTIEKHGKRWTRGDRLFHITGNNDKALAVECLRALYQQAFGKVVTVGLGDGHNDERFLRVVDLAVVVRSPYAVWLKKAVPKSRVTRAAGPRGWNEGVLKTIARELIN